MTELQAKGTTTKQTDEVVNEFSQMDTADARRRQSVAALMRRYGPVTVSKSIVYGENGDDLVFIPEPRARFLARAWHAIFKAKTWSDLRRLAPRATYRAIRQYKDQLDPTDMRGKARFDWETMTSVSNGWLPGWPAQEMLDWIPADIQEDFGEVASSMCDEYWLTLAPKDTKAIVQRLKQVGFRCRQSQRLVEHACGS